MKDLFSGAAGRINHHDGSPMFTTPNTLNVPPDYQIETDVPSIAEFVTCSLDGRLWAFRRSRRFYVVALRYDEFTQELVAASTIVLNNANFIARGVDWLLTDTTIVQASDDEPYVFTANIFNDSGTSFLYSVLRSKEFASGIDPITKQAWGLSEANGNSEGYGYFNRSALLQSVSKHYSLLSAVGDWHIIKNFLVRKADNPLADAHNNMLNIRPLIPLEFNGSSPAYGCGFDNDIFITYYNGELWGRGLYHIGRCYILPAVFDESGNPQEFYLYISPDFPRISLTQAEKFNLGILKTDDSLYGFLPSQANSLDNGLCFRSDNPTIFEPSSKQWQQISESGQMFIDTLNHSGLVLNNDGAIFLNGDSYQCKGLRQWLAPAGVVEAIPAQSVISSFDTHALATYPQQEFFREALAGKKLPLSASAYSGKRLSLGVADADNVKSIQVNSIQTNNGAEAIAWENVYKNAVEIKFLNSFFIEGEERVFFFSSYPVATIKSEGHSVLAVDALWWEGTPPTEEYDDVTSSPLALSINVTTKFMWINPETGKPAYSTVITEFRNNIPTDNKWGAINAETGIWEVTSYDPWYYALGSPGTDVKTAPLFGIQGNKIGFSYRHYTYESINSNNPDWEGYDYGFQPSGNIPVTIEDWTGEGWSSEGFTGESWINYLYFNQFITPHNTQNSGLIACFREKHSNTNFLLHVGANFNPQNTRTYSYCNNSHNELLHIITFYDSLSNRYAVLVFKSKFHTEIFDFKSETERSNLS